MQNDRLSKCLRNRYGYEEFFPRIPLSGILGKIQLLCALCDSAVSFSVFLQTE